MSTPAPAVTCHLCPALLHREADTVSDEFAWVDETGSKLGPDADLMHLPDPYAHLAALADRIMAAPKGKIDMRAAQEYGALKVRLESGTFHTHHAAPGSEPAYEGPVPEHCGWPGWLRPSGWQCRQCTEPLDGPSAGEVLGDLLRQPAGIEAA